MNRLDYKDAPFGCLAVASTERNCTGCDGCIANNYCRFSKDVTFGQCSKYMRPDKCDVVFVRNSSEAYRAAGLFNFDRALDEIVARAERDLLVNKTYINFKYGQLCRHLESVQYDFACAMAARDYFDQNYLQTCSPPMQNTISIEIIEGPSTGARSFPSYWPRSSA